MKRRKFIEYGVLGGGSFLVTLGVQPKPANALFWLLTGGGLAGMLFRSAFTSVITNTVRDAWQRSSQKWWNDRYETMLAQSRFLDNRYEQDLSVSSVDGYNYSYILAANKWERVGENVAFNFPQLRHGQSASFSGPASIGMAVAAKYLRENQRMSPQEVANAILPHYQDSYDFISWNQPNSTITYFTPASQSGVIIEYQVKQYGKGGFGEIYVTVDASRRIQIPTIQVQFA